MVVKEVILYFVRGEVIMLTTLQTKLFEQVNNVPVTNDKNITHVIPENVVEQQDKTFCDHCRSKIGGSKVVKFLVKQSLLTNQIGYHIFFGLTTTGTLFVWDFFLYLSLQSILNLQCLPCTALKQMFSV